ncbi:MAG: hypothetical protein J6L96_08650 [Clostridia bacterium]|nr:hypothetical protein [Clostridia bacterium]
MKDKFNSLLHRSREQKSIPLHGDTGISEREIGLPGATPKRVRGGVGISIDADILIKSAIVGALLILFALLQTTLFSRFRPFGVVPDLILPLVVAVAMSEREKFGAIFGIVAAFVIESLGGGAVSILPILYMPVGYIVGALSVYYFRDSVVVRALYTVITSLLRALFTIFTLLATVGGITFISLMGDAVLPELLANVIFATLPHFAVKLCLRPWNKNRD